MTLLEQRKLISYDKETETFSQTIDRPLFFIAFDQINILDSTIANYEDLDSLPLNQEDNNDSIFPDNSIIVIDEAHRYSPKSSNKDGFTAFVSFLKIHRHFGFDFIFITQSQKDLNIDIRNLVENHYRVNRPFGTGKSFVNHYLGAETTENKLPIKQSSKSFLLDKRFFSIYKSASIHNYKSSIPKKYYVFILIFVLFVGFVISKGVFVYQSFISGDAVNFGKDLVGISNGDLQEDPAADLVSDPVADFVSPSPKRVVKPYFYIFKNVHKFKNVHTIFTSISPAIVLTDSSIFCYCTENEIKIINSIVGLFDQSRNVKFDFILVSFSKKDFLDFSLRYSFKNDFFSIAPSLDLISNSFLLDYLQSDYEALIRINSSALVEVGKSFDSNFLTKYPIILKNYKPSYVNKKLPNNIPANDNNDRTVEENINFNDVGFKIKIKTKAVDNKTISVALFQSHSFLQGFSKEVPIVDKRDFKSEFLLRNGQLVPLFNLTSILNSKTKEEIIPFLSWFVLTKIDDNNSSYQVFLRFNFERSKISAVEPLAPAPDDSSNDLSDEIQSVEKNEK